MKSKMVVRSLPSLVLLGVAIGAPYDLTFADAPTNQVLAVPSMQSSVVEQNGVITVTVVIDKKKEPQIRELEGTAMLRTNSLLRRSFTELPRQFSIPASVDRADFDPETEIYTYVTSVLREDVEAFIGDYKREQLEKAAAEKAAVEKAAAEKAAAEKAAAEKAAAEKAAAEKAAAEKTVAEGEALVTEDLDAMSKRAEEEQKALEDLRSAAENAKQEQQEYDDEKEHDDLKKKQDDAADSAIQGLFGLRRSGWQTLRVNFPLGCNSCGMINVSVRSRRIGASVL